MSPQERLASAKNAATLLTELHGDLRVNLENDEDEHADNLCDDAMRATVKLVEHLNRHLAAE